MTNMEHYREELEKLLSLSSMFGRVNGEFKYCDNIECPKCEFWRGPGVCRLNTIKWLMAEHKPEPTLTAREKHLVECLQEGWLARDNYDDLVYCKTEPRKDGCAWNYSTYEFDEEPIKEMFEFITWEDEEPWSVEELRKLPALECNPEDVAFKRGEQK